ncbi:hypothetical protein MG290_13315 [Flavobacterium sp. CBA20B-1]|uniref:hypothetical protein n=1 Tax=unclassified Flavobacterium TaxID=196869 RepID=UPI002224D403|nr:MULTISPECIES: hypothetical protein [unclassified Flavobacterium]WCM41903.1 hypothetical protein MG290_13315 [Flavobacterium sp. CBA20B-1]
MQRKIKDDIYFLSKVNKILQKYSKTNDLSELKVSFRDIDFQFKNSIQLIESGLELFFFNCSLSGERIDFTINEISGKSNSIEFRNCEISSDFFIKDSKLQYLVFNNVEIASSHFHVSSNDIYSFSIVGNPESLNKINTLILNQNEKIDYIDFRLNQFEMLYINNNNFYKGFTLNANNIERLQIEKCTFKRDFEFWKNTLGDFSLVKKSSIGEVKAKQSNFGVETEFRDVDFIERVDFTELQSEKTTLKFKNCTFQKNTYFDNSTVLKIEFSSVVFQGITSFQSLNCLYLIKFTTSYFEKVGFFEGMKLGSKNSIDMNTIRTIKGQLLRSESKIDYLKYNALEQRKHFQKLKIKDSDFYILMLNSKSNDFGRNWFKGVKFTFKVSVFFFLMMIMVNSFVSSKYPLKFNLNESFVDTSTVLSEYLKFTFSLGFGSEAFQSNGYLYLIFIIAKIFIGYGIYQTITAFRKYGKI